MIITSLIFSCLQPSCLSDSFCLEDTGKLAVLIGVGGEGRLQGGEERVHGGGDVPRQGLGAAVAMLGKNGDYFTPGVKGVIRFNQIDRSRLDIWLMIICVFLKNRREAYMSSSINKNLDTFEKD